MIDAHNFLNIFSYEMLINALLYIIQCFWSVSGLNLNLRLYLAQKSDLYADIQIILSNSVHYSTSVIIYRVHIWMTF